VTLSFERKVGRRRVKEGSKRVGVKAGPNAAKVSSKGLAKGRYSVSARLRASNGKRSKTINLGRTIR
jgi:hypothetical protein